jgi:hypothetical protein
MSMVFLDAAILDERQAMFASLQLGLARPNPWWQPHGFYPL